MRTIQCDVVVVGAGPGGSMAAKYCAEGGLDTILIEKKAEIGPSGAPRESPSPGWTRSASRRTPPGSAPI